MKARRAFEAGERMVSIEEIEHRLHELTSAALKEAYRAGYQQGERDERSRQAADPAPIDADR